MRYAALLLLPTAAVAVILACTPPPTCYDGVFPVDGATNVERDTPLMIAFSQDMRLFPALAPGVTLRDETTGLDVPIVVTPINGRLHVLPERPLEADHTYILAGVNRNALDWTAVSTARVSYGGNNPGSSRFTFDGTPTLLRPWREGIAVAGVSFSEPMDPTDPPLRAFLFDPWSGASADATSVDLDWNVTFDELTVTPTWPEDIDPALPWELRLVVTGPWESARGVLLADPPPTDQWQWAYQRTAVAPRDGGSWCKPW